MQKIWNRIPGKLKEAATWSLLCKRIIYIVGFAWLCHLDHIIGSANGHFQYGYKNYTGVVIGLMILTAYKLKDFLKIPYLIWTVIFFVGRHFALQWAVDNYGNQLEFESFVWNAGVYGLVIIRMLYGLFMEKWRPKMNWPAFGLWLGMMGMMLVSAPKEQWVRAFLVFFGLFYLTPYSERDRNNLLSGMLEGIILGFCIVQGKAFMHRPYDTLRYQGLYTNSNMNALFYLVCYCAVLCKWYQMKLKHRHVLLRIPYVVLLGVIFGLTVMTMGRTALLVMALITVLFLVFQVLSAGKWHRKILEPVLSGVAIAAACLLCFVPTYNLTRYVPAYVDDPVFFEWDRWNDKVHQGDPINDPKYISFETMIRSAFGRILWFGDTSAEDTLGQELFDWLNSLTMITDAAETGAAVVAESVEPGTDEFHPILTEPEDMANPVKVRTSIYRYCLEHLKPFGARTGASDIWITRYYSAPHAHNIFLQMASVFGWVPGLLFLAVVLVSYNSILWGLSETKSASRYFRLFVVGGFTTVLAGFGMLEINWTYGQLAFTMFFVVQYLLYHQIEEPDEEKNPEDKETEETDFLLTERQEIVE